MYSEWGQAIRLRKPPESGDKPPVCLIWTSLKMNTAMPDRCFLNAYHKKRSEAAELEAQSSLKRPISVAAFIAQANRLKVQSRPGTRKGWHGKD